MLLISSFKQRFGGGLKLTKLFEMPAMLLNSSVEEGGSVYMSVNQNGDCHFHFFHGLCYGKARFLLKSPMTVSIAQLYF